MKHCDQSQNSKSNGVWISVCSGLIEQSCLLFMQPLSKRCTLTPRKCRVEKYNRRWNKSIFLLWKILKKTRHVRKCNPWSRERPGWVPVRSLRVRLTPSGGFTHNPWPRAPHFAAPTTPYDDSFLTQNLRNCAEA